MELFVRIFFGVVSVVGLTIGYVVVIKRIDAIARDVREVREMLRDR